MFLTPQGIGTVIGRQIFKIAIPVSVYYGEVNHDYTIQFSGLRLDHKFDSNWFA